MFLRVVLSVALRDILSVVLRLFEGCFEVVWNDALEVVLIVVLSVV